APPPTLSSISPGVLTAGSGATDVTLSGSGFIHRTKVMLDGEPVTSNVTSSTSIRATLPSRALAEPRTLSLVVVNDPPGGGTSQPRTLEVVAPLNVVSATST